jgi:hypothetical protein
MGNQKSLEGARSFVFGPDLLEFLGHHRGEAAAEHFADHVGPSVGQLAARAQRVGSVQVPRVGPVPERRRERRRLRQALEHAVHEARVAWVGGGWIELLRPFDYSHVCY